MIAVRRWAAVAVGVTLAAAFVGSVALVALSDTPAWRANGYAHSKSCLHRLSRSTQERVVVVLGSSRMRQAVDPSRLARDLGLAETRVVNLARPDRDTALDADQLERLADVAAPRLALIELHVGSTRLEAVERGLDPAGDARFATFGGRRYSQAALLLRPMGSLIADGRGLNPVARLHAALGLIAWRLDETFRILAARAWFDPGVPSTETDAARVNVCAMSPELAREIERATPASEAQAAAFDEAFAVWDDDRTDFLTSPSRAVDRGDVRRIVELGRRRGIRVVFLYLPSRRTPLPERGFAQAFREEMGAELLTPPRELIDELDRQGRFYDNAHLTAAGGEAFTDWVAHALAEGGA